MRPGVNAPAHKTDMLAELVCSNSLGSLGLNSGSGILKTEMEKLDSLILRAAIESRVPAGQALAVDREKFSQFIQQQLESMPGIEIIREEVTEIPPEGIVIIASGPLTSEKLAGELHKYLGGDYLFFYDAVSPVVTAESINMETAFFASRYGKGTEDYLNCAMTPEEYDSFYHALTTAERVNPHDFEPNHLFDGCMPIEEMADRGIKTLLFGPLKPVGLKDDAAAVVQLRKENREGTLYNLVGFQTRLKWNEQKRVFRMIPGLEKAEFVRYGVMHKNIYVHSPTLLNETLNLKKDERIYLAGQITGVEGYMESAATGLLAGINAAGQAKGGEQVIPPRETMLGSLVFYITDHEKAEEENAGEMGKSGENGEIRKSGEFGDTDKSDKIKDEGEVKQGENISGRESSEENDTSNKSRKNPGSTGFQPVWQNKGDEFTGSVSTIGENETDLNVIGKNLHEHHEKIESKQIEENGIECSGDIEAGKIETELDTTGLVNTELVEVKEKKSRRRDFQPMNSNFGILPSLNVRKRKKERRDMQVRIAAEAMDEWVKGNLCKAI